MHKRQLKNQPEDALTEVTARYAVAVTDEVLETIDPDDPNDPIARQYLPSVEELKTTPQETDDPIGDDVHSPVKGIVHRYPDRVLLKPVHVCSVYCRFCFRREKVGPKEGQGSEALSPQELEAALDYIRTTPQIWEVILTGGDPLVLSPRRLQALMEELNNIPHVKVIRVHTRVPVADPLRVTPELVAALHSEKAVYVVLHCNHARELTEKVRAVTQLFLRAGIPLLSQSTLLKGVNNDAKTLEDLFRALTALRIKPYYLHHPDLAPGTGHFRLSVDEGQELTAALQGHMSGIAQPRYMLDIPGGFGKVPVGSPWIEKKGPHYNVTDYKGGTHRYSSDE
ncbi:MAG: lysine-2,3-aminomutase-like protein [Proteobacteria bacterium]|nr:lysine-2,3-aminomutase-like protein [Pseudomonadota bacterium]